MARQRVPMTFIEPMLAVPSTTAGNRTPVSPHEFDGTHAFDLKLDGLRALAYWDGATWTLRNRNGVDITHQFPEVKPVNLPRRRLVLDGEIVARDNSFETVAQRGKLERAGAIRASAVKNPCTFFAFDLLQYGAVPLNLIHLPWDARRASLDSLVANSLPSLQTTTWSADASFFDTVMDAKMEGVIAKRLSAPYAPGRRSPDWIKFKVLHRVSCLVTGYTAGTGSRSSFGAMHLALIDPDLGELHPVGRVGSGMSDRQITMLKDRIDRQLVTVVEIECLNITKASGTLRQPVFKGIRTDLPPEMCLLAQLDSIPTS